MNAPTPMENNMSDPNPNATDADPSNTDVDKLTTPLDPDDDVFALLGLDTDGDTTGD